MNFLRISDFGFRNFRFPRFETSAYLLVAVIGTKLMVDWYFNKRPAGAPADWHAPMDFHSLSSPAFWVFWVSMLACFAVGFIPKRKKAPAPVADASSEPAKSAPPA